MIMDSKICDTRRNICKSMISKYGFQIKENTYLISLRDLIFHINNNWLINIFSTKLTDRYLLEKNHQIYVKSDDLDNFISIVKLIKCDSLQFHNTALMSDYILYTVYNE